MRRRQLTREWSIELDASFRSRLVNGDLQFLSTGPPVRTVWLTVWEPPATETAEEILRWLRRDVHPSPEQRFEEQGSDPEELRYASAYPEADVDRIQWGLYAYTVRRGSYVQAAMLSDTPADLVWALATWRSLRYTPSHGPGHP